MISAQLWPFPQAENNPKIGAHDIHDQGQHLHHLWLLQRGCNLSAFELIAPPGAEGAMIRTGRWTDEENAIRKKAEELLEKRRVIGKVVIRP